MSTENNFKPADVIKAFEVAHRGKIAGSITGNYPALLLLIYDKTKTTDHKYTNIVNFWDY
jgi:hypothetical protein